MEDEEAVQRLKHGDLSGLEPLVKRYQLRATRAAFMITQDHDLAEDLVVEAFLQAYKRIDQFDPGRPFTPWFFTLVLNAARRAVIRAKRTEPLPEEDSRADLDLAPDGDDPEELLAQVEAHATLEAGLARLTPKQRAALVQRYYLGMSEDEMSQQAGCAVGTIKWRLNIARERLRTWLRPFRKDLL